MTLRKLKRLSTSSNLTKLKRVDRTDILFTKVKRPSLRDILETDEFESIEISSSDKEELIKSGWIPMSSSNVRAIRIEGGILEVQFHQGQVYFWSNNVEFYFEGLKNAASSGRYIWTSGMRHTFSGHN